MNSEVSQDGKFPLYVYEGHPNNFFDATPICPVGQEPPHFIVFRSPESAIAVARALNRADRYIYVAQGAVILWDNERCQGDKH